MKVTVYNQEGKEVSTTLLPKEIFDVSMNSDLVHQVAVSQQANRRVVIAHVKDRSEVRGGGRKPWRQKGTGRARHGSNRSPIWRGGGVTFGPTKDRVFKKKINKKMNRKALLMVLSAKMRDNTLIILDSLKLEKPKTKEVDNLLFKLPIKESSCLIGIAGKNQSLVRASNNLPGVATLQVTALNVLDLLSFQYLLLSEEAIKEIKETFVEKQPTAKV